MLVTDYPAEVGFASPTDAAVSASAPFRDLLMLFVVGTAYFCGKLLLGFSEEALRPAFDYTGFDSANFSYGCIAVVSYGMSFLDLFDFADGNLLAEGTRYFPEAGLATPSLDLDGGFYSALAAAYLVAPSITYY